MKLLATSLNSWPSLSTPIAVGQEALERLVSFSRRVGCFLFPSSASRSYQIVRGDKGLLSDVMVFLFFRSVVVYFFGGICPPIASMTSVPIWIIGGMYFSRSQIADGNVVEKLEAQRDQLIGKVDELELEKGKMASCLTKMESQRDAVREERNSLVEESAPLQLEKKHLLEKNKQLEERCEELSKTIAQLSSDKTEWTEEKKRIEELVYTLRSQLQEMRSLYLQYSDHKQLNTVLAKMDNSLVEEEPGLARELIQMYRAHRQKLHRVIHNIIERMPKDPFLTLEETPLRIALEGLLHLSESEVEHLGMLFERIALVEVP